MDKDLKRILIEVGFAERYDAILKAHEGLGQEVKPDVERIVALFSELNFPVRYHKKERFYAHKEKEAGYLFQLNIAVSEQRVELILFIHNPEIGFRAGGPFGFFARKLIARIKNSPSVPYEGEESLRVALEFGIGIFEDIKAATKAHFNS
ncbi:MAG: hypothetical protein AAF570_28080 [Bacteroidota bacterium]